MQIKYHKQRCPPTIFFPIYFIIAHQYNNRNITKLINKSEINNGVVSHETFKSKKNWYKCKSNIASNDDLLRYFFPIYSITTHQYNNKNITKLINKSESNSGVVSHKTFKSKKKWFKCKSNITQIKIVPIIPVQNKHNQIRILYSV